MTARPLAATLRELADKATPGKWSACGCGKCAQINSTDEAVASCTYDAADAPSPNLQGANANAVLIVALRNAVPLILAALELAEAAMQADVSGAQGPGVAEFKLARQAFRRAASLGGDGL